MSFAGEFLGLPGLRGYWPLNAFDSTGAALDLSGNGRTLTYNGNPTYNFTTQGASYADLDGTGDYLSRADEGGLDILGTESYVASAVRGLTLGGWFYFDSLATQSVCVSKTAGAAADTSYWLEANSSVARFLVSDGAVFQIGVGATTLLVSTWYFLAGRFIPSTEARVFLNGASDGVDTSGIPAALINSAAGFNIGARNGGLLMNGRASNCFLCAMALGDTTIDNIYQNTKAFYGL